MAWRCSARSNQGLVTKLRDARLIQTDRVTQAMLAVDRKAYCRPNTNPYEDSPQLIGYNATISAPHMHAMCLELLKDHLYDGARALDVGSGSGYLTAAMGQMVAPSGTVYGVEHIPELVCFSVANLEADQQELIESKVITVKVSDGRWGLPDKAPFDAIHVGAASEGIPMELVRQLKIGGRMIVPVEHASGQQDLMQIDKVGEKDDEYETSLITGVRYVPLTDREKQWRD